MIVLINVIKKKKEGKKKTFGCAIFFGDLSNSPCISEVSCVVVACWGTLSTVAINFDHIYAPCREWFVLSWV